MYNRYVPQPDGSYRRNRIDNSKTHQADISPEPTIVASVQEEKHSPPPPRKNPQHPGVGGFLKQLLPKDFDTGDLIIVLLLLLMAGDCEEDRNNAILTLALYFMM